ncbi:MAG: hypothetical protein FWC10_00430 [Lentimicrobiaceae bacterium]|nr:hypothetical protein [Lentimicrobiaceae bacterium]
MKKNTWIDIFIELLQEKYPRNSQLIAELVDLLCLEREAVYRRLRKDVAFTANEIAKIATTWNISFDEVIGAHSGKLPFQMLPLNYLNPSPKEFYSMHEKIKALDDVQTAAYSEYMEVCNVFPKPLRIGFPMLFRFSIFYWAYHYRNDESQNLFSKIVIPDSIYADFEYYKQNIVHVQNTSLILDEMVFEYFIHNVNYFHSILAITDKEKGLIKKELYALLDYMKEIANNGCYPETRKKVFMYISQLTINTNYNYYYSENLKTCSVSAFGKDEITSNDSEIVANFREWMNLKKRAAIQISEVNEKRRFEFFNKQKKIVDSL